MSINNTIKNVKNHKSAAKNKLREITENMYKLGDISLGNINEAQYLLVELDKQLRIVQSCNKKLKYLRSENRNKYLGFENINYTTWNLNVI